MELQHKKEVRHQETIQMKYDALQMLTPVSANKHWVAGRNRHLSVRDARKPRSGLGALSRGHIASSSTAGRQLHPPSTAIRLACKSGAGEFGKGCVEKGGNELTC